MADPRFRLDLYRGTGRDYDQFRLLYPRSLIDDLVQRSGADGRGRLLDLACGTGQLAFALRDRFIETWAVDQEPDMIAVVAEKARSMGGMDLRLEVSAAEDLSAPEESFDLVGIGNAFHRMRRDKVAHRVFRWLRPGGFVALVWGRGPWDGNAPWQQTLATAVMQWRHRLETAGDGARVPAEYEQARQARLDLAILHDAGFELAGSYTFKTAHDWTPDSVVGFAYGTSVLSRVALGHLASEFEQDLERVLEPHVLAGPLHQVIDFGYDLARRPLP